MSDLKYHDIALVVAGFYKGQKVLLIEHDKFSDIYYGFLQSGDCDHLASFAESDLKPLRGRPKFDPGKEIIKQLYDTAQILKLDDYR